MHPHVVWLFKNLKKIKDKWQENEVSIDVIENFCKGINKRRHATALMAAFFDVTHQDTKLGKLIRDIDRKALAYTKTRPEIKKYDLLLTQALDDTYRSHLYKLCQNYKSRYGRDQIPDIDNTDFDSLLVKSRNFKQPKLFDPENLFQGV